MEVHTDERSQDITCKLSRQELRELSETKPDFFSECIRANDGHKYFYVNRSQDPLFSDVPTQNGIQIKLPDQPNDPFLINFDQVGYSALTTQQELSVRYLGGQKLFIALTE